MRWEEDEQGAKQGSATQTHHHSPGLLNLARSHDRVPTPSRLQLTAFGSPDDGHRVA